MPKKGQNDLKFGHNIYYVNVLNFKDFVKNCQKIIILLLKINDFSFFFWFDFRFFILDGLFMHFQGNGPIGLIFGTIVPSGTYYNNLQHWYLVFGF